MPRSKPSSSRSSSSSQELQRRQKRRIPFLSLLLLASASSRWTRTSEALVSPSSHVVTYNRYSATATSTTAASTALCATTPRRTRRIDDILFDNDNNNNNNEYDNNYDNTNEEMTISSLESSLKKEQERSSTLAVRLAYAEKVIAEQKKRLEANRSSLVAKDQVLNKTQRKLKELETRLETQDFQPAPQLQQQQPRQYRNAGGQSATPPWQSKQPPLSRNERQYPLISNWAMNPNTGEVTGSVSCHPSIPDGTTIVTSGLNRESMQRAGNSFVFRSDAPATVVTTQSGSMYQLGAMRDTTNNMRRPVPNPPPQVQQQQQQLQQQAYGQQQQQQQAPPPNLHPSNQLNPNLQYPLTGQSISNGRGTKYLLAGAPKRKPSGRSEIIMAYRCDEQMRVCDTDKAYVVKLSTQKQKLQREYNNFMRVQSETVDKKRNLFGSMLFGADDDSEDDPFVRCYDFLPVCEGSIKYAQHSALVLEKGHEDLRDYEYSLQVRDDPEYPVPTRMDPRIVQASLAVAAKCLQTLHSKAQLVYTDLKAENLIFMTDQHDLDNTFAAAAAASETGGSALLQIAEIKGIDLESCIPYRGHPLDYTPEASPPEFAQFHLRGNAYEFVLEYSYDVWSFGMLAYELATGKPYFRGKTPEEIMQLLGDPEFVPPLAKIQTASEEAIPRDLQDLIRSCLKIDPRKRPTVVKILKHRYFSDMGAAAAEPPSQEQYLGGTFTW